MSNSAAITVFIADSGARILNGPVRGLSTSRRLVYPSYIHLTDKPKLLQPFLLAGSASNQPESSVCCIAAIIGTAPSSESFLYSFDRIDSAELLSSPQATNRIHLPAKTNLALGASQQLADSPLGHQSTSTTVPSNNL